MTETKQWKGRTGGGKFGQKFLLYVLKKVRVSLFYPILWIVIPFYCLFGHKTFNSIYHYFRNICHFSKCKSFQKSFMTHLIFGRVVLDKFAVLAGNTQQFNITVDGVENFNELLTHPEGFFLLASHIGNFEIIGHCLKQNVKPINCVAYSGESEIFQNKREQSFQLNNVRLIQMKEDLSHIFAIKTAINKGEIVMVMCDRIWGSKKTMEIEFMGEKAEFPLGTFMMAAQCEVPVLFVTAVKEKHLSYHGFVSRLDISEKEMSLQEKSKIIAREYAKSMESILKKYPEQWFNFYDFWNNMTE